jgi:hypothetical protein
LEKGIATSRLRSILSSIRQTIERQGLDTRRLPGWLISAKIRTGWINNALVAVLEDSPGDDTFLPRGLVHSDSAILLDIPDFLPKGAILDVLKYGRTDPQKARTNRIILMLAENPTGTVLSMGTDQKTSFLNVGYGGYFSPHGMMNMFLQWKPGSLQFPLSMRFIPLALFIHEDDLEDTDSLIDKCVPYILNSLQEIHDTPKGDHYASINRRLQTFGLNHDTGVIVLGSYAVKEVGELLQIRDALRNKNFDAHLIEDLPETPLMSLPDKVRHWTGASRFSVMIDRKPSGHLNEYEILKHQETILALLHRRDSGSTRMIGVESLNYRFIQDFEFDASPLEAVEAATEWANSFAEERIKLYKEMYPWK